MKSAVAALRATLSACAISAALLCAAQPAAAAVITTLPDAIARDIPKGLKITQNPISFADGVTYQARNAAGLAVSSNFGSTSTYSFANSGQWSGTPMVAIGLQHATMGFTFADPVSAALAEFNWARPTVNAGDITFRIFNASGTLLEKLTFNAADPAYQKGFYGFQRAVADISRFEVEGYWVGARNLSTSTAVIASGVPEPASWAMMIVGFGAAGAMVRGSRRRELALAA